MKAYKENHRQRSFNYVLVVITLIGMILGGCDKDDDDNQVSGSISVSTQTFEVNGINNCSTSAGTGSTFVFTIPYSLTMDSSIGRLLIRTEVTDGSSEESSNSQFTDENNTIVWANCFRFGSQDWVEYEVRLETADGTVSNASTVRVIRPDGAN